MLRLETMAFFRGPYSLHLLSEGGPFEREKVRDGLKEPNRKEERHDNEHRNFPQASRDTTSHS